MRTRCSGRTVGRAEHQVVVVAPQLTGGQPLRETQPGVTWLPRWVSERLDKDVRAVVVDERNPAAEVDWLAARVRPTVIGHREVAVAAGALLAPSSTGTCITAARWSCPAASSAPSSAHCSAAKRSAGTAKPQARRP